MRHDHACYWPEFKLKTCNPKVYIYCGASWSLIRWEALEPWSGSSPDWDRTSNSLWPWVPPDLGFSPNRMYLLTNYKGASERLFPLSRVYLSLMWIQASFFHLIYLKPCHWIYTPLRKIAFFFNEVTCLSFKTFLFILDNIPCFEVVFVWY